MHAHQNAQATPDPSNTDLSTIEWQLIQFFVQLANTLSLPRSLGEIFGLLFASPCALNFAQIVERLHISKGSASQGLQTLQKLKAIRTIYVAGDRRTYYAAETSVRILFNRFLTDTVQPHLKNGQSQLAQISKLLSTPSAATDEATRAASDTIRQRIEFLQNWHRKAQELLPLISELTAPDSTGGRSPTQ